MVYNFTVSGPALKRKRMLNNGLQLEDWVGTTWWHARSCIALLYIETLAHRMA